ncbi:putative disease resistance RPP13-like protein 3 [Olea europaea var. sylvestris]|uniref:putative disease resistance RPP13-like protein 3 n=1 Tax=Olea europaea var. sylvestris TaxID=158386 RepID=UPI000C1D477E|nr:putative disease resistance RPP13-like protein 3 [Olea europaea var. sylvestris]
MGGIGKTTLASNIYNDSFIKHHFHIRAWTTLSQEYHVRELLVDLLKSTGDFIDEMNQQETDQLKTRVYQPLDELTRIFPDDNNGSRIILTTRLSSIAANSDSPGPIHHLSFLSPEQSWNLLCQKAFVKECCPSELEEIGRRIAEKGKGLPLALVVIGGVLYKAEKTRANWEYVAENVKSAVTGNFDDFMEILSWSYNHLPHRLRASFLYMGVSPEDYFIHVTHLIRFWVAEGFIKPITHNNFEEVAKEYLEELIDRNLIMVRHRICTGEIITCSIHDRMRELCVRKAREGKFLHITDQKVEISTELMKNQRHLSIHRDMRYDLSDIYDSTIRSLLYFTDSLLPNSLCFQLLRALEAEELLKMPQLRHLLFDEAVLLCSHGPQNANLQELSGVIDFRFTQEALQIIPNLRTLRISYYCDRETGLSLYCLENLVLLEQLESLKCNFWRHIPLLQNLPTKSEEVNFEWL